MSLDYSCGPNAYRVTHERVPNALILFSQPFARDVVSVLAIAGHLKCLESLLGTLSYLKCL